MTHCTENETLLNLFLNVHWLLVSRCSATICTDFELYHVLTKSIHGTVYHVLDWINLLCLFTGGPALCHHAS